VLYLHLAPFYLSSLCPVRNFLTPNYLLLAPKNPLFNAHFTLSSRAFKGSGRFYLYRCGGYLCLIATHLAANRKAFSTKTHYVLHQNALHLAAYCTAFSGK